MSKIDDQAKRYEDRNKAEQELSEAETQRIAEQAWARAERKVKTGKCEGCGAEIPADQTFCSLCAECS